MSIMSFSLLHFTFILSPLYIKPSIALKLPVPHNGMVKREFYILKPSPFLRHKNFSVINCNADVYHPSKNFLKVSILTCKLHATTAETTTYFFEAKVNVNHNRLSHPPSAAVCAEWARLLTFNGCNPLAQLSDHSWATTNVPSIVYAWPTSHSDTVKNALSFTV